MVGTQRQRKCDSLVRFCCRVCLVEQLRGDTIAIGSALWAFVHALAGHTLRPKEHQTVRNW